MDATGSFIPVHRRLWLFGIAGAILLFLVAPIIIVIPVSFSGSATLHFPPETWSLRWYERLLSSPYWRSAASSSIVTAISTLCCTVPMATLAAYGLINSRSRLVPWIWGIVLMPLVIPLILMAVGIYFFYASLGVVNTLPGLVAAHVMYTLPIAVITITAGLARFDMTQELVARSLGANRLQAFLGVTLPQIKFSITAAAFLTFIGSFDEVVIAMFVAGGPIATLPKQMFNQLRNSIEPTIAAVSTILICVAFTAFAINQLARSRSAG
jgi:putative spermidine/putrescine transport system permease protein